MPIVGILIVGSPERQIVGVLIVRFPEHQQHNVNLQKKGRFGNGGLTASSMIKSAKGVEREKRTRIVRISYLP